MAHMYSLGPKKNTGDVRGVGGLSCILEHARAVGKTTKGANKYVATVCKPKYSTLSLVGSSRSRGSSDNADVCCFRRSDMTMRYVYRVGLKYGTPQEDLNQQDAFTFTTPTFC